MALELFLNQSAFILENMIEKPLIYTYLHGGTLFGLGGHGGRPEPEICSMLTNVPSKHWEQHPEECDALINTKIRSVEVLCGFLAYISFIGFCVWRGSTRVMNAVETMGGMILGQTWKYLTLLTEYGYDLCISAWSRLFSKEIPVENHPIEQPPSLPSTHHHDSIETQQFKQTQHPEQVNLQQNKEDAGEVIQVIKAHPETIVLSD